MTLDTYPAPQFVYLQGIEEASRLHVVEVSSCFVPRADIGGNIESCSVDEKAGSKVMEGQVSQSDLLPTVFLSSQDTNWRA